LNYNIIHEGGFLSEQAVGVRQFFAHPLEPMDTPMPGAGSHRLVDSKPLKMG